MNTYLETLKNRCSIRNFTDESIPEKTLNDILDVVNSSASSSNLQMASVIHITDPKIKKIVSEVGTQPFIAKAPHIFIFVVDVYRNIKLTNDKYMPHAIIMDNFLQGFTDGIIMAQSLVDAAEINGLGSVYLGSITRNLSKIIEVLKLPKYTFPIVGLALGIPNEKPIVKPKMPKSLRFFENTYKVLGDYETEFAEYNELLANYDPKRISRNSFIQAIESSFSEDTSHKQFIETIKAQGFDVTNS